MSTVLEAPVVAEILVAESVATQSDGPQLYRFSADAFYRMIDGGVFVEGARVELSDGQVFGKMAKTQAHTVASNKAYLALARLLPAGWFPGGENPVTINEVRVPLPDLVILRGVPDDYIERRPAPTKVGLIVEFALSSLTGDTTVKLADYARAGIPAYWVIDLRKNLVLVFERPINAEGRYESSQTFVAGQTVPLRLDGVLVAEVAAADLLPIPR